MRKFIYASLLISAILTLSGCSVLSGQRGVFRDRSYDYQIQKTYELKGLKMPQGVKRPDFRPYYTLPQGPSHYGPTQPADLTPPGFHKTVKPVPSIHAKKVSKKAVSTKYDMHSRLAFNDDHQGILFVPGPLKQNWMKVGGALSELNYSIQSRDESKGLYVLNANKTMLHLYLIQDKDTKETQVTVFNEHDKLVGGGLATNLLERLKAKLNGENVPAASKINTPAFVSTLDKVHSEIVQDGENRLFLTIDDSSPKVKAWVKRALIRSGYKVTNDDSVHGFYSIMPKGSTRPKNERLVYVFQRSEGGLLGLIGNKEVTRVAVFSYEGNLLPKATARKILEKIQSNLKAES